MTYPELFQVGKETKADTTARGGVAGVVQREIRLPVGAMSGALSSALGGVLADGGGEERGGPGKVRRSGFEQVRRVRAAQGRTPEELAMAARAFEMLGRATDESRVSAVRTAMALGSYDTQAKIDFVVERILEDVDNGVL